MTDTRTPLYEDSIVVGGRTIQVGSGFADLETDAWRHAGLHFWAGVISGEQFRRGQTSHALPATFL
jgi:hypothetical protein